MYTAKVVAVKKIHLLLYFYLYLWLFCTVKATKCILDKGQKRFQADFFI